MPLSSYIVEQALRQLGLPDPSLRQFALAQELSNVDGRGFPRELFQLSAPVVVRGLLNFAVFQMRRAWIYPAWVHRQLDPDDVAYVARSQNPLFINTTCRNWTMLGSPHGAHEAIVDRHGLATPLPREWSVDVWLFTESHAYFPSLAPPPRQEYDTSAPLLSTHHEVGDVRLLQEHFVGTINQQLDILYQKVTVSNAGDRAQRATAAIAVRPFNPEGMAPIEHVALDGPRFIVVNGTLGVVLAETPDTMLVSSGEHHDLANLLRRDHRPGSATRSNGLHLTTETSSSGLGHAVALFDLDLEPGASRSIHASVALGHDRALRSSSARRTWRVSYGQRLERHRTVWKEEAAHGAQWTLPDAELQAMLDAHRVALLQLHDKDRITPGPFLYHHMWYRDAAVMCRALDVLGHHDRVRAVINGFRRGLTTDGFFRGPDGEWDSNGAVLWSVRRHFELTRSVLWLRSQLPSMRRAGRWIVEQARRCRASSTTHAGLMPKGLSAEHLGTVDQYYWDMLFSLSGLRELSAMSADVGQAGEADEWRNAAGALEEALRRSLNIVEQRLGAPLVPATPMREFDESAIGSVAGVYPLGVSNVAPDAFRRTVRTLGTSYVRDRGFLHPFIHSGYNPYLTMQLAHAELWMGDTSRAWEIARTILQQSGSPYSLPEAIHPRTLGGAMGDGHHGWAAAEIILFLRDALIDDRGEDLVLLEGAGPIFAGGRFDLKLHRTPTRFGTFDMMMRSEPGGRVEVTFRGKFFNGHAPARVVIHLPFIARRVLPTSPHHLVGLLDETDRTIVSCSTDVRTLVVER